MNTAECSAAPDESGPSHVAPGEALSIFPRSVRRSVLCAGPSPTVGVRVTDAPIALASITAHRNRPGFHTWADRLTLGKVPTMTA
jgi:hypothetical protein